MLFVISSAHVPNPRCIWPPKTNDIVISRPLCVPDFVLGSVAWTLELICSNPFLVHEGELKTREGKGLPEVTQPVSSRTRAGT